MFVLTPVRCDDQRGRRVSVQEDLSRSDHRHGVQQVLERSSERVAQIPRLCIGILSLQQRLLATSAHTAVHAREGAVRSFLLAAAFVSECLSRGPRAPQRNVFAVLQAYLYRGHAHARNLMVWCDCDSPPIFLSKWIGISIRNQLAIAHVSAWVHRDAEVGLS